MSTTQIQLCLMVAVAVEISGAKWLVGSTAGGKVRIKALMPGAVLSKVPAR